MIRAEDKIPAPFLNAIAQFNADHNLDIESSVLESTPHLSAHSPPVQMVQLSLRLRSPISLSEDADSTTAFLSAIQSLGMVRPILATPVERGAALAERFGVSLPLPGLTLPVLQFALQQLEAAHAVIERQPSI